MTGDAAFTNLNAGCIKKEYSMTSVIKGEDTVVLNRKLVLHHAFTANSPSIPLPAKSLYDSSAVSSTLNLQLF